MKRRGLILLALLCALASSCSLLPEEETFGAAPLIRSYEREEFKLAFVERGDMELSRKVICTYVPVQTQVLSYPVGGIYHDEVFVSVGDNVKAGQLLAQLDSGGIQDEIDQARLQLTRLDIRMGALEENRALAVKRQELIAQSGGTQESLAEALKRVEEDYLRQKQALEDEKYLLEARLEECQERLKERQIRAGIDGTVTFVRNVKEGDVSVAWERFVTVADSTMSLFRASTEYWNYFEPGQEYEIIVSKEPYEAVVTSEEELGLPEQAKTEGKQAYVYLKLKTPSFELEDGDRGNLTVVLDSRSDVLMVPEGAVTTAGELSIVYYQDEEGMKAYKPVVTGLAADGMVEIISGLEEGESVIAE